VFSLDQQELRDGRIAIRQGDATLLDAVADGEFDIVHSNSVIEHIGGFDAMAAMAAEVRRIAPRHWIQTPNLWFPIEPHLRRPFYQFLPAQWRARSLVGRAYDDFEQVPDLATARAFVDEIHLLGAAQLQRLFPTSRIERERVLGLTKSLIAVRD